MELNTEPASPTPQPPVTYWITRFVVLRWMGFVYLMAFYVAARQLVPLVGAHGLTPAQLFMKSLPTSGPGWEIPTLFWFDCSDTALRVIPWLGVLLSIAVLSGYANALILFVLWVLYFSIVQVGQDWYAYGWEIQMLETGFLTIFLCPLLDCRPFPRRPTPLCIIFLFRWLIVRIMLGAGLIKLRGDSCWHDLTALYYHFETQPIPNPLSVWFHFLPHWILQAGVIWTFVVELGAPFLAFWPQYARYLAGVLMVSFQFNLIISGNLSFFNWLTIVPALACFDDRFWCLFAPRFLAEWAKNAEKKAKPSRAMQVIAWIVTIRIAHLSIAPINNLLSPEQDMNRSFDPLHLVNTYGAFGSITRERLVLIVEGTDDPDPDSPATTWKEYPYLASPWDPKIPPKFIAPYQPHLDWQLWFAAMSSYQEYPWTINMVWKLLHNDPDTLSLFGGNPFPDHPPKWVRIVVYKYKFAQPGNPEHLYWDCQRLGLWLPALSADSPALLEVLHEENWTE